jgi:4-alpha-glucanotransferase
MTVPAGRRRTGLLIPLFSAPSTASWGIGDIGDIAPLSIWLAGAGCRVLLLLPLNEMAPGQQSPYSALSAMAIDPVFIRVPDVEEFQAAGGEAALLSGAAGARAGPAVTACRLRRGAPPQARCVA